MGSGPGVALEARDFEGLHSSRQNLGGQLRLAGRTLQKSIGCAFHSMSTTSAFALNKVGLGKGKDG